MSYYFTNDPDRKENRKMINFRFLTTFETFISDDGVFSKSTLDFGSRVLLETLINKEKIDGDVLDLGCGIGYIGIMLKKYLPAINLTMADVNSTAVILANMNSLLYKQDNIAIDSDGFTNIHNSFDVIVSNPPIRTGKAVIYRLFKESYEHLKDDGLLYLVIRKQQGAPSAVSFLQSFFASVEIIEKENGYWIIKARKSVDSKK